MRIKRILWLLALASLVVILAACGGDDSDGDTQVPPDTPTASAAATVDDASGFNPSGSGISFGAGLGGGSELPGCSDPNDEECPAALDMALDGSVSSAGVTMNYPQRYFVAEPVDGDPDGMVIRIVRPKTTSTPKRPFSRCIWWKPPMSGFPRQRMPTRRRGPLMH